MDYNQIEVAFLWGSGEYVCVGGPGDSHEELGKGDKAKHNARLKLQTTNNTKDMWKCLKQEKLEKQKW